MKTFNETSRVLGMAAVLALASLSLHEARAGDDDSEIEGTVTNVSGSCPTLTFSVGGLAVSTNAQTRFDDGTCSDVTDGRRVEVEGVLRQGKLIADEVELKPATRSSAATHD